jgi:beta-glucosidase
MRHSLKRALRGLAAGIAICGSAYLPGAAHSTPVRTSPPSEAEVRKRADALLAQMTPEEKAGQLSQYFYFSFAPALNAVAEKALAQGAVGSLLFVTDPAYTNRLQKIAVEQTRMKIPLLFGFDVIHGLHTIFPVPIALAASWDPPLVEKVQAAAGGEARAVGVHWAFAPMVDIARDPRWGRMVEGAGEDPYLAAAMAAAQVRGFQGPWLGSPGHIMAGPKHFAGYGAALGGRDYDEANISESELWNVYLPPFKAAIDAGAGSIMSAYMPLNGVPASGNHWLLTDVLRGTWGFKGFVVSDSAAVNSLVQQGFAADKADAAARALNAGLDMEMSAPGVTAAMQTVPQQIAAGRIPAAQLDNAARLVLEAKIRMGLFENPYVDEKRAARTLADPASLKLARSAAVRSAVLLKNDNALLPLDRNRLKSIAVIGPLADSPRDMLGPWVFPENTPPADTVLQGIRAAVGSSVRVAFSVGVNKPGRNYASPFVMLEKGFRLPPPVTVDEDAEIRRAVALAQQDDVAVLVLGEAQDMAGEAASRSSLLLPGRQQELLDAVVATGKPVVVVLLSTRPLDLKNTKAGAILDMWYPGSAGGGATADLLFGKSSPGGKLPFSWVRSAAELPNPYAQLLSHAPSADKRYWNGSSAPYYPFGYGLSYTAFEYSNLRIDRPSHAIGEPVTVTVDLRNAGPRDGDEVAQLYIHQRYGTSARPVRELKGFQRVSLKAGEKRTLTFTLTPGDLRYWSAASAGWVQDASRFDVWIGGDEMATAKGGFEIGAR